VWQQNFQLSAARVTYRDDFVGIGVGQGICLFGCMPEGAAGDSDGFSLVDALIASLILASALGSLAQLIVLATTANDVAGRNTVATLLVADKLEEIRSGPVVPPGIAGSDVPRPGFIREWSVSAVPTAPLSLALIQVTVRTHDGRTQMFAVTPQEAP